MKVPCPTCGKLRTILTEEEELERNARQVLYDGKRREKRIESGLCASCNNPRVTEWYCEKHRKLKVECNRRRRDKRNKAGLCANCSGPLDGDFTRCLECRIKHRSYKATMRDSLRMDRKR